MRCYLGNEADFDRGSYSEIISEWTFRKDRGSVLSKTPEQIMRQMEKAQCVTLLKQNVAVAFGAIYFLESDQDGANYWELGSVIINPGYRGQGICHPLYKNLIFLHDQLGGVMLGTTKQRSLLALGLKYGLNLIRFQETPKNVLSPLCWQAGCYKPINGSVFCQNQWDNGGECWLRYRLVS